MLDWCCQDCKGIKNDTFCKNLLWSHSGSYILALWNYFFNEFSQIWIESFCDLSVCSLQYWDFCSNVSLLHLCTHPSSLYLVLFTNLGLVTDMKHKRWYLPRRTCYLKQQMEGKDWKTLTWYWSVEGQRSQHFRSLSSLFHSRALQPSHWTTPEWVATLSWSSWSQAFTSIPPPHHICHS